ncbi:MAG: site-specific integrase [Anaerolineae bacterium]|nr:site-specific integrase [Anaerolineae bacterium]
MSELIRAVQVAAEAGAGELVTTGGPLPSDRNPAAVYLAGLSSERARRAMLGRLRYMAGLLGADDPLAVPWHMLPHQHAAAIRARLTESGQAPATIHLNPSAWRGVAREAFNLGLLSADDYARLHPVKNVRGERSPAGRSLSHGKLAALAEACADDATNVGPWDCAIIGVMYTGGLRREEVPALDLADYHPATGELRVHGKGDRERRVWINNGTGEAMADWLKARGTEAGPLLLPVTRGGRIQRRRLNLQTIYDMLARRAEEAGVRSFSPHDLRRTFVGDMLDAGADVVTVQALAGHASPTTMATCDRRPEETKRRAASLLHLPYRSRKARALARGLHHQLPVV